MTTKEKLHRLVNALPETDSYVLNAAERYPEYLAQSADPVSLACELAPDDDEPVTDPERAEIAEGWSDYQASRGASTEDVRRELGLSEKIAGHE